MPPRGRASRWGRWPACRSRSRTCSMSQACRRWPAPRSIATGQPAAADATLIARLEAAGAVLVGALNMGEYAYDFTGENVHDGPSRNPHDTDAHDRRLLGRLRRRGGRRAGAARARLRHQRLDPRAVLVLRPVRPEADLRPPVARRARSRSSPASTTSGRWRAATTRSGARLRRHAGPRCRKIPVCADRPHRAGAAARSTRGVGGLRIAVAGGYFKRGAVARGAGRRGARRQGARMPRARIEIPEAARARAAAFIITATRGRGPASRPPAHPRRRLRSGRARPADRRRAGAGRARGQGAEVPPLVSRAGAEAVRERRCDPGAGHALHRAAHRPADHDARRRRGAAAAQHRHLHAADLVHRPAGGGRAGAARAAADRRADHRRAVARGRGAAHRLCAGEDARWPRRRARPSREDEPWRSTCPRCVAEVRAAFERYEQALVTNDVATLDAIFRKDAAPSATASPRTSTATRRSRPSAPGARRST